MGSYATELKKATTFVNKENFDEILVKIKEVVECKYKGYGWRNDILNAETFEDAMENFGIKLIEEETGYYRPVIKDVYVSHFFDDLIKIVAPYMTDGVIVVNDEYDDVTIRFRNHNAEIIYVGEIKKGITIELATEKPSVNTWNYPIEEINYIFQQIADGTRENGETFYFYNGRLYESCETEE